MVVRCFVGLLSIRWWKGGGGVVEVGMLGDGGGGGGGSAAGVSGVIASTRMSIGKFQFYISVDEA